MFGLTSLEIECGLPICAEIVLSQIKHKSHALLEISHKRGPKNTGRDRRREKPPTFPDSRFHAHIEQSCPSPSGASGGRRPLFDANVGNRVSVPISPSEGTGCQ